MSDDFKLGAIEGQESVGLDSYLGGVSVTASSEASKGRRKIAFLGDLDGFLRVSADQLIHKADGDLWSIQRTSSGEMFVERLFTEGDPLK